MKIFRKNIFRWWVVTALCILSGVAMFSDQIFGASIVAPGASYFLSFFILLASCVGFFIKGRRAITPISVVFIAFAINLGFPALYTSVVFGHHAYESATVLGLFFIVLSLLFFPSGLPLDSSTKTFFSRLQDLNLASLFCFLIIFYVLYILLFLYEPFLRALWRPVVGIFPSLFAASAIIAIHKGRWGFLFVFVALSLLSLYLYLDVAFIVGGRINVAAMFFSVVIVASFLYPSWVYKVAAILVAPFGIMWAGFHRAKSGRLAHEVDSIAHVFESGYGIGSILAPFTTLVEVVERSKLFGVAPAIEWLHQLVFSLAFWVPRAWWDGKPEGFGRLLVYELRPEMSHTGHSMAASIFGEFSYYFGFLGPFLSVTFLVLFIRLMIFLQRQLMSIGTPVYIFYLSLFAYMQAQLLTLIWGSLGGYSVRAFAAALGLLLMIGSWRIIHSFKHSGQLGGR